MGLHIVGKSNDYGGDDNPPSHGRDTAVFQELQPLRKKFGEWLTANRNDLFNDELVAKAEKVADMLEQISDELNTPI